MASRTTTQRRAIRGRSSNTYSDWNDLASRSIRGLTARTYTLLNAQNLSFHSWRIIYAPHRALEAAGDGALKFERLGIIR